MYIMWNVSIAVWFVYNVHGTADLAVRLEVELI